MINKKSLSIGLVWFRNDLRFHDNETFHKAEAENDLVVPLYVFDTRNYRTSTYGFKKTGHFRTKFLLECVADLHHIIRGIGGQLAIHTGIPEDIIPAMCQKHHVTAVYLSQEVAPEETLVEKELQLRLSSAGVRKQTYNTASLLTKELGIHKMPDMFTAYRWQVERINAIDGRFPAPTQINVPADVEAGVLPDITSLNCDNVSIDGRAAIVFVGGETAALARPQEYVWDTDGVATYFDTRNELMDSDYSTKFSAWLATGCVSARVIHHSLKAYERERVANKSTYWVTFELLWWGFFRFTMEKYRCELFFSRGPKRKTKEHTDNYDLLHQWINGKKGSEFVDANMNDLGLKGFMSNRGGK